MENGDLQRRFEFPVVNWKKLVWYHMTFWTKFKYTLRPECYQEYQCYATLKKVVINDRGLNYVELGKTVISGDLKEKLLVLKSTLVFVF